MAGDSVAQIVGSGKHGLSTAEARRLGRLLGAVDADVARFPAIGCKKLAGCRIVYLTVNTVLALR
jgi:hypothetical protein